MRPSFIFALCLLAACQVGNDVPTYYDIGVVHRRVTTPSPEAQLWFDRGLALCYGFNHEEAIRCFDNAQKADPECAMAHWGTAYALGPNYNNAVMSLQACGAAHTAVRRAAAAANCSPLERELIEALRARYPDGEVGDRAARDRSYADKMRTIRSSHPGDPDIAAFTAESVMQLRPWQLWTPGGEPAPEIPEIRSILEPAMAQAPDHPGLCHLYIHAMEAGPEAAAATSAAERLENLVPGLGHLVHMPSHIYIWTGRYRDSLRANQKAVEKDRAFAEYAGGDNFYLVYRLHNYHFIAYSAMWTGQREVALAAARELVREIPATALAAMPDLLDIFVATPLHVLVRFGMWDAILAEPEPAPELPAARAVWHYARGVALAVLGRIEEAQRELFSFVAARSAVPETRVLFNNPVRDILAVADAVLSGELQYRRGNYEEAFELLRKAVALDEKLNYDEPWGWMEPARHALGALLVEQGRYAEAEAVYRRNLARYPNNGWALHGLAECLAKTGQEAAAAATLRQFEQAWSDADTQLPGSCFCRTRD